MHRVSVALLHTPFAAAASGWVYANSGDTSANADAQEATWGGLCKSGDEQSPINVVTGSAVKTAMPVIETHISTSASYVKNTGHGFQLFETAPASHTYNSSETDEISEVDSIGGAKGYSVIGGAKYNFYQVHWHTPSENTVDGKSFPLEAHFVHQLDDDALHGTYHRLAVIGLLYELGSDSECNTFLDKFWDAFTNEKGVSQYSGENFDLNAKLTDELAQGYWHWYGSLTTPPCTEGVSWNLLKVHEKVCQRQVDKLREALGATQDNIKLNNRVPQPLNHRVVAEMAPDAPAKPTNNIAPPAGVKKWLYAESGHTEAHAATQNATWGGLCVSGHEQSPIDIVTASVKKASTAVITTHLSTTASYVKNTGHGFQLFETKPSASRMDDEGTVSVDDTSGSAKGYSMVGGDKHNFYQVHWHTPSENTIDGQSFPLEAHFVHQLDDLALHGTYHRLAVVGLLYELGSDSECNAFLDKFWESFPLEKGNAAFSGENFDLNKKLSEELAHGYYHWYGSLTTPPCTEGVSWNLLKVRERVCQRQLDRLKEALGKTQDNINFNNRVTQPLNHRIVTETDKDDSRIEDDEVDSAVGPTFASAILSVVLSLAVAAGF
jgi:carbonic anhydrase